MTLGRRTIARVDGAMYADEEGIARIVGQFSGNVTAAQSAHTKDDAGLRCLRYQTILKFFNNVCNGLAGT